MKMEDTKLRLLEKIIDVLPESDKDHMQNIVASLQVISYTSIRMIADTLCEILQERDIVYLSLRMEVDNLAAQQAGSDVIKDHILHMLKTELLKHIKIEVKEEPTKVGTTFHRTTIKLIQ